MRWKGAAPQNEKEAHRAPFADYFRMGPCSKAHRAPRLAGLSIRQDSRAVPMAQDTEWTPVTHDTCDQVAGPFYHGTRADLAVGELLSAGFRSNYRDSVVMNHIYFTTIAKGAGLAAEMARGEGRPRVYVVEPTGPFEDDPNVTNKKFPGTRRGRIGVRSRCGLWERLWSGSSTTRSSFGS